ncbi:uncharacterized protein BO72DRAFT_498857 [Aspergillus fijiensis CBS 313.89]|uniref:Uncharacterized protein n=1 Tax=Aspergillus fijiensis CBS 313.89 TaxID=1448319 RepID=A0A8G1RKW3_9EURO|nr:uncharacterized protein BO72DRAFT_498857 [Aspergillus fijiensis CBS 313.89]RAK74639.1 hypothetical protein BO72DRAFT_498857 [Aspergillus fijiensis CBS 313.89]
MYHEFKQGPIKITVGHEHGIGYFIRVEDERLAADGDEFPVSSFNEACYSIDSSGLGIYLAARTGNEGSGTQVSIEAMRRLWELYGVMGETIPLMELLDLRLSDIV